VPIKGVCDHHDLGCIGAVALRRGYERQLQILKSMGCNALRTSHNPPDPQLLDLCDEMGFLVMDEAFDEWKISKKKFGYGRFFDQWSDPDLTTMIDRDRNHPSIILWSIGNEIREGRGGKVEGGPMSAQLVAICHREDPTRPATSACAKPWNVWKSGVGKPLDIYGINYCPNYYAKNSPVPEVAAAVKLDDYDGHLGDNPLFRNYLLTGEGAPRFISDFLSVEEWQANKFRLASESMGVADTLTFSLTETKPFWIFLALSRPQRDFTPRDREMAALLRTHFSAAYANALAYTQSQAKAMVFDQMVDSSRYGLMLLDQSNQIIHISPSANDLMRRYFPLHDGWKVQLPLHLQNWIKDLDVSSSVTLSPLVLVHEEKRLVIRASLLEKNRRTLLLRETVLNDGPSRLESLGLSKREAEVLYWIAEGKSNSELAVILGVSKRTVEKHLESIFKKLHVENRMSAMVVANGTLARSGL
jgi:DNA-binding CsgD family transcriptional regulator